MAFVRSLPSAIVYCLFIASAEALMPIVVNECGQGKIVENSAYLTNLFTLYQKLIVDANVAAQKWIDASDTNFDANTVYGRATCNSDLTYETCQACLEEIKSQNYCESSISACVELQECSLSYNPSFIPL